MNYPYLLLVALLASTTHAVQWYQYGNPQFLDWTNFDTAVTEPNTYKFVKYFTHSCRYCRMIKQVVQELQKQKKWMFSFYEVDCTLHDDLCEAKAAPTAFPFVGIYNLKGELETKIRGYYPLDTMRKSFEKIERRQLEALKLKEVKIQISPKIQVQKKVDHQNTVQPKTIEKQVTKQEKKVIKQEKQEDFSESITQGIKILLFVFGIWMYEKQIRPYFSSLKADKTRLVQIQISSTNLNPKEKSAQNQQNKRLLKDTL